MKTRIEIYCDGGARGNPGPAGIGFVAFENGKETTREKKYIGKATNNVAEYSAVLAALGWLSGRPTTFSSEAVIHLDSELVVKQLSGIYRIKDEKLKKLAREVKKIESRGGEVSYVHIPRAKNKIADSLVNAAIDAAGK